MENILLGDVYFIKYIFRLADKHMLSKVMLKCYKSVYEFTR